MNSASTKEVRMVVTTSPEVRELIQQAAELAGISISQFIVEAAVSKACALMKSMNSITLSLAAAENVLSAMESHPAPNQCLLAAADRYSDRHIPDGD
jgi:uncharacterized protein (DUF1778 family)